MDDATLNRMLLRKSIELRAKLGIPEPTPEPVPVSGLVHPILLEISERIDVSERLASIVALELAEEWSDKPRHEVLAHVRRLVRNQPFSPRVWGDKERWKQALNVHLIGIYEPHIVTGGGRPW